MSYSEAFDPKLSPEHGSLAAGDTDLPGYGENAVASRAWKGDDK